MMHSLDVARDIGAFLVRLGILVFVHEMGHYLAARWRGVYVEAFSIGFGPKIVSWTDRVGTVWKLCWLPLGGYVKLHGQERPEDMTPEGRALLRPGQTFNEKSVGSRAIVVAAGPIANFALALVLFIGLFGIAGRPYPDAVIGTPSKDSAAAKAGLLAEDRVLSIDGTPVARFGDIARIVSANPGRTMDIRINRGGVESTVPVQIASVDGDNGAKKGLLGVRAGGVGYERIGPIAAITEGAARTWDVGVETLAGVGKMIGGHGGADELRGPLGIAQISGEVSKQGWVVVVGFVAVLSINLGLVNLFPIPVLDGGHLLFYAAEAVRRRPLPPRFLEYGFRAGVALLMGLFVFATWNDLSHFGLFRWVAGRFG